MAHLRAHTDKENAAPVHGGAEHARAAKTPARRGLSARVGKPLQPVDANTLPAQRNTSEPEAVVKKALQSRRHVLVEERLAQPAAQAASTPQAVSISQPPAATPAQLSIPRPPAATPAHGTAEADKDAAAAALPDCAPTFERLVWEEARRLLAAIGDWGSRPLDELLERLCARGCDADEATVVKELERLLVRWDKAAEGPRCSACAAGPATAVASEPRSRVWRQDLNAHSPNASTVRAATAPAASVTSRAGRRTFAADWPALATEATPEQAGLPLLFSPEERAIYKGV